MQPDGQTANRRLDSWKEIAGFFGRDESTVKRWEKERSLPVHRLPGSSRSRVFAFTEELATWMKSRGGVEEPLDQEATAAPTEVLASNATIVRPSPGESPITTGAPSSSPMRASRWIQVVAIVAAIVLVIVLAGMHRHDVGVRTSTAMIPGTASGTSSRTRLPAAHINPEAQELYLQGRYYWNKRTPADLNKAVDYFTQAIVKDPNYALAYVGLADSYNLLREFSAMPSSEAFPRALAAAQKAVELDDLSAEAHASLAFATTYWSWDLAKGEREFRRAIELNPDYAPAHHWYATALLLQGRLPEALEQIDRAQQLDPASVAILSDKAMILAQTGQREEAITLLKQIEASQPAFYSAHQYLSYIYLTSGEDPGYMAEGLKSAQLAHNERQAAIMRAAERGWKSGGERGMLQAMLQLQKRDYSEGEMSPFLLAVTYCRLGMASEALKYLELSRQQRDPNFLSLRSNQGLNILHNEPEFRKLVAETGLPPLP